ncbi:MAG: hypothetical protein VX768_03860 [Planctomycetota bacterium]|nr:hypothetical protein [Planctomycetota bacterium]
MKSRAKTVKTVRQNSKETQTVEEKASTEETGQAETQGFVIADLELDSELHSLSSEPFVGKWNDLVSTTNWEKGRIILEWREALVGREAPASQYSDEAWSQLVGGVTSQHVGRLRRVFQKFGDSRKDYEGLYWSHFHAAIDWSDPELWLEGAIQNSWSVSQMRKQRWETMGKSPDENPENYQVISAELDEDFEPAVNREPNEKGEIPTGPRAEGPDFGDEENLSAGDRSTPSEGSKIYSEEDGETVEFVRPFANIGEMPEDLAEAFDAYKLAIIHHKTEQWQQISRDDILASLDALKELAKAPSAEDAPF